MTSEEIVNAALNDNLSFYMTSEEIVQVALEEVELPVKGETMSNNFEDKDIVLVLTAMTVMSYQEGSLDSISNSDLQDFIINDMMISYNDVLSTGTISDIRQGLENGEITVSISYNHAVNVQVVFLADFNVDPATQIAD